MWSFFNNEPGPDNINRRNLRNCQQFQVTKKHFVQHPWLNQKNMGNYSVKHYDAFCKLMRSNFLPLENCLKLISQLNESEVRGICHGLRVETVRGLNSDQIYSILYHDLTREEVLNLNKHQLTALSMLKKHGLNRDNLINNNIISSESHANALYHLVAIKRYSIGDALRVLWDVKESEAYGISVGLERDDVRGKESHHVDELIKIRELNWLESINDLTNLSKNQILVLKKLCHLGMTRDLVIQFGYTIPKDENIDLYLKALFHLIIRKLFSADEALITLSNLSPAQLRQITNNFTRQEVCQLNDFQAQALFDCRTSVNKLSVYHFMEYPWFNSQHHVNALYQLIIEQGCDVSNAFAELQDLNAAQLQMISEGKRRDDFIGLNQWQEKSVNELSSYGLRGSDLRGKDHFNSESHYKALEYCIKKEETVERALLTIKGMNQLQAHLVAHGHTRNEILNLSEVQLTLLNDDHLMQVLSSKKCMRQEIINANWFKNENQLILLKELCNYIKLAERTLEVSPLEIIQLLREDTIEGYITDFEKTKIIEKFTILELLIFKVEHHELLNEEDDKVKTQGPCFVQ